MNIGDALLIATRMIRRGVIVGTLDDGSAVADIGGDDGTVLTPALPWVRAGASTGFSTWTPPGDGEGCIVLCPDGDFIDGVILAGITTESGPVPSDPAKRSAIVGGVRFEVDASGNLLIDAGTGNVTIKGARIDLNPPGTP